MMQRKRQQAGIWRADASADHRLRRIQTPQALDVLAFRAPPVVTLRDYAHRAVSVEVMLGSRYLPEPGETAAGAITDTVTGS